MWPFALVMGVHIKDCRKVGRLVGVKTFINEFVAFEELGKLIKNRELLDKHIAGGGNWTERADDVLLFNSGGNDTVLVNGVIAVWILD